MILHLIHLITELIFSQNLNFSLREVIFTLEVWIDTLHLAHHMDFFHEKLAFYPFYLLLNIGKTTILTPLKRLNLNAIMNYSGVKQKMSQFENVIYFRKMIRFR